MIVSSNYEHSLQTLLARKARMLAPEIQQLVQRSRDIGASIARQRQACNDVNDMQYEDLQG
jgi:hypothetical protein